MILLTKYLQMPVRNLFPSLRATLRSKINPVKSVILHFHPPDNNVLKQRILYSSKPPFKSAVASENLTSGNSPPARAQFHKDIIDDVEKHDPSILLEKNVSARISTTIRISTTMAKRIPRMGQLLVLQSCDMAW